MRRLQIVPINSIFGDPDHVLDFGRVVELASVYEEEGDDALPPIEVVPIVNGGFILVDGWHRITALSSLAYDEIRVTFAGPQPERSAKQTAQERALESSITTAKRLSRSEKLQAIQWLDQERPESTNYEIGALVGIDHQIVGAVRDRLEYFRGVPPKGRG